SGRTPALWPEEDAGDAVTLLADAAARRGGGAGSGGAGGGRASAEAPPTPKLLDEVRKLPPARDVPNLGDVDATAEDPRFRLARVLRPVRKLLTLAVLLVG